MSQEKICPTCGSEYPANERFCPRDGTALRSQGGGTDLVGSIIAERYHVLKKLGEGGMGQVYLAEHVKMGRKSAVKVMNPGMVNDADAISRFNREAANASRINHPNVAGIYDFGETSEGLIYLAMEFIEGESLTSLVEKSGALAPARAAEITRQAAEGLQVAHDMGIVHRDLKPDNIMIAKNRDGSDCVKVVDFGIAKAAGAENQKVTKTGLVVGTPEYMSPEQLAGDKLDGRSDVYSLALVAFNMFTGKLPFVGESAQESMIMRLTDDPKSLADMKPDTSWPAEVQEVMAKALKRKAGERYQNASKFGVALWQAVERMPKNAGSLAGTAVLGAATALMPALPPTRIEASTPAAPVALAPTAALMVATQKSKAPMYLAGGVVAAGLAAAAIFYFPQSLDKSGATPPGAVKSESTISAPTGPVQNPGATTQSAVRSQPLANAANGNIASPAPRTAAPIPATQMPAVSGVSYEADLLALFESIGDSISARKALAEVSDWAPRATLPADRAILDLTKAKAFLMSSGLNRACPILKSIKRADLPAKLKSELDDAVQSCP